MKKEDYEIDKELETYKALRFFDDKGYDALRKPYMIGLKDMKEIYAFNYVYEYYLKRRTIYRYNRTARFAIKAGKRRVKNLSHMNSSHQYSPRSYGFIANITIYLEMLKDEYSKFFTDYKDNKSYYIRSMFYAISWYITFVYKFDCCILRNKYGAFLRIGYGKDYIYVSEKGAIYKSVLRPRTVVYGEEVIVVNNYHYYDITSRSLLECERRAANVMIAKIRDKDSIPFETLDRDRLEKFFSPRAKLMVNNAFKKNIIKKALEEETNKLEVEADFPTNDVEIQELQEFLTKTDSTYGERRAKWKSRK